MGAVQRCGCPEGHFARFFKAAQLNNAVFEKTSTLKAFAAPT